ncbi:hypothetical protein GJU39_10690 [Pedobacter petrophilus]|uniref:Lipoprotein n=1 Tax=Pedobacter petrophilus TaxID=1908241 RepID=A0A7K0G016_9SPHI|nr:hypothetical protein [Pedobacter petrophilus]MRX76559.1 hypothetical protein [Pedobacter petrophilus]
MKFIYLLFAMLALISCKKSIKKTEQTSEKQVGIGLLNVNTTSIIYLYKNEKDAKPIDSISFKIKNNGSTKFITDIDLEPYKIFEGNTADEGKTNINMGLVHFGPSLKFRVIDSTKNAFKIMTNEKTYAFYYLRIEDKNAYYTTEQQLQDNNCIGCPNSKYNPNWFVFETWERYLKRVAFARKKTLQVYDQPNGKIIFTDTANNYIPFSISQLKGDWVKIEKPYGTADETFKFNGWTRWKKKSEIIIEITEQLYD